MPPVMMKLPTRPASEYAGIGLRGPAPLGAMQPEVDFVLNSQDPAVLPAFLATWSPAAQAAGLLPAPWVAVQSKTRVVQGEASGILADGRACGSGLALMDRDYQGQVTFEMFKIERAETGDAGAKFAGPTVKITHIPTGSAVYSPIGDASAWGAGAAPAAQGAIAAEVAGLTMEPVAPVPAAAPAPAPAAEAPKRTRRTKAEMEAARAAEATGQVAAPAATRRRGEVGVGDVEGVTIEGLPLVYAAAPAPAPAPVGSCGTPALPFEAPAAPIIGAVSSATFLLTMNAVASRTHLKLMLAGDILAGLSAYFPGADYWAGGAFDRRDVMMRNGEALARALRTEGVRGVVCSDTPDEKTLFAALLPFADVVIHGV